MTIPIGMRLQRILMNISTTSKLMTDRNIFIYGETEVSYLKKRDKKLAEVMEKVGPIEREVIPDLFAALVNSIIGQQISTKAHKTIWKKMVTVLGEITAGHRQFKRRRVTAIRHYIQKSGLHQIGSTKSLIG